MDPNARPVPPPIFQPLGQRATVAKPEPAPMSKKPTTPAHEHKDSVRELVETVVFVVVLVLLLKSFIAEAFIIPTGSMAETLLGYHKYVTCPECKFDFPVNCSSEVDPQQASQRADIVACTCPNCRKHITFTHGGVEGDIPNPTWYSGDRVLVAKFPYDFKHFGMNGPERYQVVVFKYPEGPQKDGVAMNYIKRLIGLPNETIAVYYGKLYKYGNDDLKYPDEGEGDREIEHWRKRFMNEDRAKDLFMEDERSLPRDRKFKILRKKPDQILAERRIVFDNDRQAIDLLKLPPRWQAGESGWSADNNTSPHKFTITDTGKAADRIAWLRYKNLIPDADRRSAHAELISDFMGYNSYEPHRGMPPPLNWVGDLLLECEVTVQAPKGEFFMELSKGVDRFRAKWDLSTGNCTLSRIADGKTEDLSTEHTSMKKEGTYRVRFGNIDERLIVWVDSSLPFKDGVEYGPPGQRGPTENDLEPASIGASGASVSVQGLKLWRDTYYTDAEQGVAVDLRDKDRWDALRHLPVKTFYVQPGHYLCMGDNSPESFDGRSWGLVPERLLLGRALVVYWPHWRASLIH